MKKTRNKNTKSRTTESKKTDKVHHINLRHVKLSKDSRKALRKIKEPVFGNVASAIEGGDWYIPSTTYEFVDIKTDFENSMYDFYDIPKSVLVEVDYFDTGILSFDKGIYPKYHR